MDATEDLAHAIVATFGFQGDELKEKRTKLAETSIPFFFERFEKRLQPHGYFTTYGLTVAELKVRWLLLDRLNPFSQVVCFVVI